MHYRSDWPEAGFSTPVVKQEIDDHMNGDFSHAIETLGGRLCWTAFQNQFESELYAFPIWDMVLSIRAAEGGLLSGSLKDNAALHDIVRQETDRILDAPPWEAAYVSAKVVKGEPLCEALLSRGFKEVEHRRLYTCQFGELRGTPTTRYNGELQFLSLEDVSEKSLAEYQEQILGICRETFSIAHTRHFTDGFFSDRRPGVDYFLAAMRLNFSRIDPRHFFIALDAAASRICGFTVIGKKTGPAGNVYTQLLSAVSKAYQGQGIYRGLTDLLSGALPPEESLLNVTHVANEKIQRAYQNSGRRCITDTVVLRRVY